MACWGMIGVAVVFELGRSMEFDGAFAGAKTVSLTGGGTFVARGFAFFVLGAFNFAGGFFFNFFSEELVCLRFIIRHVEKATQTHSLHSLCQGLRMKQQKTW